MYCIHAPQPWLASLGYLYFQEHLSSQSVQYGYYVARERYLFEAYQREQVFLDGDCKNLPLTLALAELMPAARFLHIVRKPESFIASGLARGYFKSKPPQLWGHLAEGLILPNPEITLEQQIAYIAKFWNIANGIAEEAKQLLGKRVTTLIAESMFDNPESVVRSLEALELDCTLTTESAYQVAHLNKQAHFPPELPQQHNLIQHAIERYCDTRSLYYG